MRGEGKGKPKDTAQLVGTMQGSELACEGQGPFMEHREGLETEAGERVVREHWLEKRFRIPWSQAPRTVAQMCKCVRYCVSWAMLPAVVHR